MTTPFDRQLDVGLYVAADRARREGRPIAVLAGPTCWTNQPADQPDPPGYWRVCEATPQDTTEEARMGIAKKVWTAHTLGGQRIPKAIVDFFGEPTGRGERSESDLFIPDGSSSAAAAELGEELRNAVVAREIADRVMAEGAATPAPTDPAPAPRPTRRELALRRLDKAPWPPREVAVPVKDQVERLTIEARETLGYALNDLWRYRMTLRTARSVDASVGGRRYTDDARNDCRRLAIGARERLRPWIYRRPEPDVDPFAILRAMAPWLWEDGGISAPCPTAVEPGPTPAILDEIAAAAESDGEFNPVSEIAVPSRRELALRRSDGSPWPPLDIRVPLDRQIASLPDEARRYVDGALARLAYYRGQLRQGRDLDRSGGGGRWYLDFARQAHRDLIVGVRKDLHEFVYAAPRNLVDPFRVLKALAPWLGGSDNPGSDTGPEASPSIVADPPQTAQDEPAPISPAEPALAAAADPGVRRGRRRGGPSSGQQCLFE